MKLPVAPDNGNRHFSKLFNVEETKGIIHYRIYPACDVVQSVWYNISALIRCNFIVKNYVNRKITLYIYLLIFTILLWLHIKHVITLKHEKGKCERVFVLLLPVRTIPVNTSTSDHEKHGKVRQHWRQKRQKHVYA